jgi:hypothetical protein
MDSGIHNNVRLVPPRWLFFGCFLQLNVFKFVLPLSQRHCSIHDFFASHLYCPIVIRLCSNACVRCCRVPMDKQCCPGEGHVKPSSPCPCGEVCNCFRHCISWHWQGIVAATRHILQLVVAHCSKGVHDGFDQLIDVVWRLLVLKRLDHLEQSEIEKNLFELNLVVWTQVGQKFWSIKT